MKNLHANQWRHGFTLIEAMIAVTISTLVLLMAAAAVRSASQSLRQMERVTEENHLLMKGWLTALQDVDYWNSHANPDFPYLAGPMSQDESLNIAGAASTDHPWAKRPFRATSFSGNDLASFIGEKANPNLLLPSDPRSWYRGGTTVMTPPIARPASSFAPRYIWTTAEDSIVGQRVQEKWDKRANKFRYPESKHWPIYPTGWSPRAITGNYSAISRALAMGDGSTEFKTVISNDDSNASNMGISRAVTDYLPSLQWYLFSELGHVGAARYLPAGTLNIIYRPDTNRTVANIGKPNSFFDWGEVPWSLANGSTIPGDDFSPIAFETPSAADVKVIDSGGGVTNNVLNNVYRRNMLIGFQGSGRTMREIKSTEIDKHESPRTWSGFQNNRGTSNTLYATDLETVSSRHLVRISSWNSGPYHSVASFYPGRIFRLGNDFDLQSLVDGVIMDPARLLVSDDAKVNSVHSDFQLKGNSYMERRFKMETQHQPVVATNDDRRLAGFGDGLQMRHDIVRYRANYGDHNKISVTVANPESGAKIELNAKVIGSTFTGARSHWGWKSSQPASIWNHHDMGDRP